MKRFARPLLLLMLVGLAGLVLGQSSPPTFELVQQLGQPRPRGIQYDPNFDQLVWVDPLGRLLLVDAMTFETRHILYETGFYNAYRFSHDGRYLALAIDLRVEIWDTATGTIATQFTPDGSLRAEGPLFWSPDDGILSFNTQVRAPRELRRSENDTTNLPWVWDVAAALGERRTVLPGARAVSFFDYRNGFVYGANNKAVVGLPERLQVLDITPNGTEVIHEIPANRFEQDPIIVWASLRDDYLYIRPDTGASAVYQLDTATGALLRLPIGASLGAPSLARFEELQLSRHSTIIGEPSHRRENSLLRALLGSDYALQFGASALTVTLVDFLEPATPTAGSGDFSFLLYIYNEDTGRGFLDLLPGDRVARQLDLSPDGNQLIMRQDFGTQRIERYDLDSGERVQTYLPALPPSMDGLLAFNRAGDVILSDFQRFDVATGDVLLENLNYNFGYDRFFFNDEGETLITISGDRWWEWDIFTGEVIRRETFDLQGELLAVSEDGERYLTRLSDTVFEVYEIGMDDRRRITVEPLRYVNIEQILPSPDWEHFLVVYSVNSDDQHAPGNQIRVYSLDEGLLWHVAGADLPGMSERAYEWLDDETLVISSAPGQFAPERVYGVQYDASGIPACLVEAFPETYQDWIPVWQQFNRRYRAQRLHELSANVCEQLPLDEEALNGYLFPTATPTRLPVTATPSVIAGVPACLTSRFPDEAREYAAIWRELSEGLTPEETAELEVLLCENLTGESAPSTAPQIIEAESDQIVMTFNVRTGVRQVSSEFPPRSEALPPNVALLDQAFRQQFGFFPDGILSLNERYFAVFTQVGHIAIYRLLRPYKSFAQDATATVAVAQQEEAAEQSVSLRPTSTESAAFLGTPRPTLTPTVTPTMPPRILPEPEVLMDLPAEEVCPFNERFMLDNPPPEFAPNGRIFTTSVSGENINRIWVLQPEDGSLVLDDTLPRCQGNLCRYSPDGDWLLHQDGDLLLSRPDGSEAMILFTQQDFEYLEPTNVRWVSADMLTWQIVRDDPERQGRNIVTQYELNPNTRELRAVRYADTLLSVVTAAGSIVTDQPRTFTEPTRYWIEAVSYETGRPIVGTDYYLIEEGLVRTHLGRSINETMGFEWHPLGEALYYSYNVSGAAWYRFDTRTGEHSLLGRLPGGTWSNDGRYRIGRISLPSDEVEERLENGEPIPSLQVWDSETDTLRRYCFPQPEVQDLPYAVDFVNIGDILWSPDSRYVLFFYVLPWEAELPGVPLRTFLLDTETGSITEISTDLNGALLWTHDAGGYR